MRPRTNRFRRTHRFRRLRVGPLRSAHGRLLGRIDAFETEMEASDWLELSEMVSARATVISTAAERILY
jgi:hypothetical protein